MNPPEIWTPTPEFSQSPEDRLSDREHHEFQKSTREELRAFEEYRESHREEHDKHVATRQWVYKKVLGLVISAVVIGSSGIAVVVTVILRELLSRGTPTP